LGRLQLPPLDASATGSEAPSGAFALWGYPYPSPGVKMAPSPCTKGWSAPMLQWIRKRWCRLTSHTYKETLSARYRVCEFCGRIETRLATSKPWYHTPPPAGRIKKD
jgi:hypothetical protein